MMFLWQLLNLELWYQEVVDCPHSADNLGPERAMVENSNSTGTREK